MCHGDEVSFLVRHCREIELVMGLAWMVVRGQPAGAPGCSRRDFVNIHPLLRPGSDLRAPHRRGTQQGSGGGGNLVYSPQPDGPA